MREKPVFTRYVAYNNYDNSDKSPTYDWVEINELGTNLELSDDTTTEISLEFNFLIVISPFL